MGPKTGGYKVRHIQTASPKPTDSQSVSSELAVRRDGQITGQQQHTE